MAPKKQYKRALVMLAAGALCAGANILLVGPRPAADENHPLSNATDQVTRMFIPAFHDVISPPEEQLMPPARTEILAEPSATASGRAVLRR